MRITRLDLINNALVALGIDGKSREVIPTGSTVQFAGTTAPEGWLLCDGSAVSRSDYANLFKIMGTAYGAGDGSTTFNIPDCRGEFVRGADNGRGVDSGRTLGSSQGTQLGQHNHPIGNLNTAASNAPHSHNVTGDTGTANINHSHPVSVPTATGPTTTSHSHNVGPGPQGIVTQAAPNYNASRVQNVSTSDRVGFPVPASVWNPNTAAATAPHEHNSAATGAANLNHPHPSGNLTAPASNAPHSHNVDGVIGNTGETPNSSEMRPRNITFNFIIKV